MPELTRRQRIYYDNLTKRIEKKRAEVMALYYDTDGTPTPLYEGTQFATLYAELVALRQQRNNLLARYRNEGMNI